MTTVHRTTWTVASGECRELTFQQRQRLELHILRVAVPRGALRLLSLFLERPLRERVDPIHERSRRHFANIKVSEMTKGRERSMRILF